jgi:ABC-2 type transport system ATP-binding protein
VEIRGLIKKLGKEKLVFMSSHILQEIQATVDRIMIIHEGKIVANGTSDELMSNFMGNVLLNMEIKGGAVKSIEHIQAKLPSVKFISMEDLNGIQHVQFEYDKGQDPREELFRYAVDNNWSILKMTPHTTNLEDIFRDLTTEGDINA